MRAALLAVVACVSCAPVRPAAQAPAPPPAWTQPLDPSIEEGWRTAGLTPPPAIDDGAFLRRVTLDLIGRPPTLDEARAFLADGALDKRGRLVDRLLATHAFAEHWADVYGDLLFGQDRQAEKLEKQFDPASYLTRAFAENWGWDRLAREMITASGDVGHNGAVAFFVARTRGGGGPEAVAAATARLFLGLQIQCAQCHDHPYDTRWKQEDFYGLVAYFARTRSKNEKVSAGQAMMMASLPAKPGKVPRIPAVIDVDNGDAIMRRPHSTQELIVQPRFLGRAVMPGEDESRRQALARAVLASDLFPKAMVARTWSQLIGRGLGADWDDLGAEHDPKHPALLNRLAADFAASGYDLKALLRRLMLSTAYAREVGVRPLSPDQLFRSLLTETGAAEMGRGRADQEKIARRLEQAFREYRFVFADDEMADADRFDGSVPQALLLLNGELTNNGTRAEPTGVLGRVLAGTADPAVRVDDLFLATLTRRPTADERQPLLDYLRAQRGSRAAYEDLFFALVTSTEATTRH
jgi:hypothetical protein